MNIDMTSAGIWGEYSIFWYILESGPNCRWPLSVKISLTYCILWVHFQRSGRLDGLLANNFFYFSLVKHFYQILYGLNGPVISWYHI